MKKILAGSILMSMCFLPQVAMAKILRVSAYPLNNQSETAMNDGLKSTEQEISPVREEVVVQPVEDNSALEVPQKVENEALMPVFNTDNVSDSLETVEKDESPKVTEKASDENIDFIEQEPDSVIENEAEQNMAELPTENSSTEPILEADQETENMIVSDNNEDVNEQTEQSSVEDLLIDETNEIIIANE